MPMMQEAKRRIRCGKVMHYFWMCHGLQMLVDFPLTTAVVHLLMDGTVVTFGTIKPFSALHFIFVNRIVSKLCRVQIILGVQFEDCQCVELQKNFLNRK